MQSKCKHNCRKCTSSSVRHSKGEVASALQVSLVGWLSFKGSSSFSMLCRFGIEYMRTVQLTDDFLASSVII